MNIYMLVMSNKLGRVVTSPRVGAKMPISSRLVLGNLIPLHHSSPSWTTLPPSGAAPPYSDLHPIEHRTLSLGSHRPG